MPPRTDDDTGSLEKAREQLYKPGASFPTRAVPQTPGERALPRAWGEHLLENIPRRGQRHLHLASVFFFTALAFFLIALSAAGYFFYFGGNSVSVNKVAIDIQGPTTVSGGDTVTLSFSIINRNPVALENATIEIGFPEGTLTADAALAPYPRYSEELGTISSGATVTRSIKAVVFGGAGEVLTLPVVLAYGTGGSSADFVKKSSYALAISSTPLSLSVESLAETVSGKPITFALTVRSNANVPIENVVITNAFPFGFTMTKSSVPIRGSHIALGTLEPGESTTVTVTGTLSGQDGEERVFRFTVGTLKDPDDSSAVAYMTQDAHVLITAPFIAATLTLNGDATNLVVAPGGLQQATVAYTNTLATNIANATIAVAFSGSAVDYDSIKTTNGFYRSFDRTIVFSRDTDPSLATLAPGASGIGTFTFSTVSADELSSAPSITFTISVSGTRVGQANVPEEVRATVTKTVKVATAVVLSASALHFSGTLSNSGPLPPKVDETTTYTVVWDLTNRGSAVAGGLVTATLPSYVSYLNKTAGNGSFSYNESSRTVSWNTGDLSQNANVVGVFQVALTPSLSQRGSTPALTGPPTFTGYDRFAGTDVSVSAEPVTTETKGDPGYSPTNATVQ